ncbi:hypothetical protein MASR1M74_23660 [Lentimicrobium sp.]
MPESCDIEYPFRLSDILDDVLITFQMSAHEKGLEFETACNTGSNLVLLGDPPAKATGCIPYNAIKFTYASGYCAALQNVLMTEAVIEVHDTGIGIAPEAQGGIFDDFHQTESSSPAAMVVRAWIGH